MTPPRGVGDAAPYNDPQGFSLSQTGTAACGQAALRMVRKLLPRNGPVKSRLRAISRHSGVSGALVTHVTPKQPSPTPGYPRPNILPRLRSAPRGSGTPTAPRSRAGPRCGGLHVHIAVTDVQHTAVGLDAKVRHQARVPSGAGFVGTSGSAPRTTSNRSASKYRATTARANSSALLENTAIRTPAAFSRASSAAYRGTARSCRACARRRPYQTRPASRPAAPGCGSLRG